MSASTIQITELPLVEGTLPAARSAWKGLLAGSPDDVRLYEREDGTTLLEIRAYETWPDLGATGLERQDLWDALATWAAGDFRREILTRIEEPKPTAGPLPETEHLELRYVEVRPPRYEDYRAWRDETIFDVVRTSPEISTFSAYHTVMTTRPGVLFLSGFDGDPGVYRSVFSSDRYKEIVQAAGDNYITGGNHGLATRIYTRVGGI
ncbi:hypothetical protein [Sanguibacter sp. Leaf3]|uniref:hypothetical protein n=1 Tax=Sanguibacter sp. Leaf3 TaxID=1736209 RepID=UPI0007020EE2|nr:hypothetical protein [Sanguibacter sp. Leaf3]KQU00379.1 hypothetical protein ASG53_06045 [Sanguibacter sp. Leaf3]